MFIKYKGELFYTVILLLYSLCSFTQDIQVIELRNYLVKHGQRDKYTGYFGKHIAGGQNTLGGYVLGQYNVKGEPDHFFWIRGFKDMSSRKKFLQEFYISEFWQKHKHISAELLVNYDNVYLLEPIMYASDTVSAIKRKQFEKESSLAVVNFYIANQKLDTLIRIIKNKYLPLLKELNMDDVSFWISEKQPNDFPELAVFQDKNLLVSISYFKNESDYYTKKKNLESQMSKELKNEMPGIVTTQSTLFLTPTKMFTSAKSNK